jgi:glyoxylase-like metal-dependent hydrolase (beta-lactamase superfamily II)
MKLHALTGAAVAVALATGAAAQPQQNFDEVVIESQDLGGGVHMLTGSGGNIGLLVGEDGALMVDDQYAPLSAKIAAKVEELGGGPVRFVINTHHHGDHAGGNAPFAEMGATVVAHDNVRTRLSQEQQSPIGTNVIPAAPEAAWPLVTFAEDVTFHMNGQTVRAFHVPPAHTDGDAMIYFEEANVLHGGDVFTTSGFPLIDVPAGGSLEGFVADLTLAVEAIDDDTKVIPGHGPLSTRADIAARRDALQGFVDILKPLAESDLTIEQIIASRPLDGHDEGFSGGFISTESFITSAVTSMRAADR